MIIRDKIRIFTEELMELEKMYKCNVYVKERDTRTFDIKVEACVVKEDDDSTHLCCEYAFDIWKVPDVIDVVNKTKEHVVQNLRLEKRRPNIYSEHMFIVPARHNGKSAMLEARAKQFLNDVYATGRLSNNSLPKIKDVIYNGPATIVLWADNTKTVVKAQEGDEIDYEKGLAMAISKKALGNKGNYCETFKKWKYEGEPISKDPKTIEEIKNKIFSETMLNRFEKTE